MAAVIYTHWWRLTSCKHVDGEGALPTKKLCSCGANISSVNDTHQKTLGFLDAHEDIANQMLDAFLADQEHSCGAAFP